jgi:hypothetical protein
MYLTVLVFLVTSSSLSLPFEVRFCLQYPVFGSELIHACMHVIMACVATTTKSDLFLFVRCFLKLFGMSSTVNAL